MKKLLLLFTIHFSLFTVFSAFAQIDIGQNDIQPEKRAEKIEDTGKEGLFSFMNFSFGKKKDKAPLRVDGKLDTVAKLEQSAVDGNVDSQMSLAYMYLYGESGVSIDYQKAFKYYSMAAEKNNIIALNNLGSLYFSGIGVDKNYPKAIELFKKASDLGNREAGVNLAFIYLSNNSTVVHHQDAMDLFKKASDAGNPTAQFMLGYAHYRGFMVDKDDKKAFELIRNAATAKYDDAQYVLAIMYLNGTGITKNYGNAVNYLKASAVQGDVDAMLELGKILASGQVYNKDINTAHIWFNIASVYGNKQAAQYRDSLEKQLKIDELLQAQAQAETFEEKPSELTLYIRQTFGKNIRGYIDENVAKKR